MKKRKLLNSEISSCISKLGHTDTITIGDCGLPIPDCVKRIDLCLTKGIPEFIPVLMTVLDEMSVEKIVFAEEIKAKNKDLNDKILEIFAELEKGENRKIIVEYISHEEFKLMTASSKAVIRTGEFKPFANIILVSGVTF